MTIRKMKPPKLLEERPRRITIDHSTSDSSVEETDTFYSVDRQAPLRLRLAFLTCVSQTERPEPQIGGRVGDAAQAVLDGVDGLMHRHVREVELPAHRTARHHGRREREELRFTVSIRVINGEDQQPPTSPELTFPTRKISLSAEAP